ncbi:hypothetical protein E1176_12500 [Fulvivirga sp. RKSG066]|uniref:hypothetical protein n=1 Tax=Fulvivirga aurantia TaxID=2529383 RepID=UPI0012BBC39D|nr:hypothetical protein [Fulvivirga aurantia]MTI21844.1 hypothetical protein [Fulvivirga aurantia]
MKKISIFTLILFSCLAYTGKVNAQGFEPVDGFKQVNFGVGTSGWGVALWGGMDYGIANKVTIGPWVGLRTNSNYTAITVAFRGDYHYGGHIDGLPKELDLYGGLGMGYTNLAFDNTRFDGNGNLVRFSDNAGYFDVWLSAGGRWYFSPDWGVMLEFTGASRGNLAGALVGLSYKF